MKRISSIALAVVVIAAAGFAAASIASGASLADILTGTTATTAPTTTTATTATTTTPGDREGGKGRRVTVCHVTGSKKHPAVTVTVSEHAAASVIKHGGHLGACTGSETAKPKGKPADALAKAKGADNPTPTAKDNAKVKHSGETEHTTTSATTTTTTTAAAAPTKGDGSKGSDHSQGSNDQGKSSGQGSNGSGHGKH